MAGRPVAMLVGGGDQSKLSRIEERLAAGVPVSAKDIEAMVERIRYLEKILGPFADAYEHSGDPGERVGFSDFNAIWNALRERWS